MLLTDGMPAAVGWVILIAAGLSALSVLAGRLMLLPGGAGQTFRSERQICVERALPSGSAAAVSLSFMKKEFLLVLRTLRPMPSDTFPRR